MKAVLLLLLSLCIVQGVTAQSQQKGDRSLLGANAEGTHFFVGFMQNEVETAECRYWRGQRQISVASRFTTTVTVILPNGQFFDTTIAPYKVCAFDVDFDFECIGEGVFRKGIEIRSDRPISVYCYSGKPTTSDGYLALPVDSWGTQYVTASYYLDHYSPDSLDFDQYCNLYPRGGELAVIASQDSTLVSVIPATRTLANVLAGANYTRLIHKGDIFQVQDGGLDKGRSDLTGSVVTSNKPVGVLSGHVRTGIPVIHDLGKDHLIEMIPPRNALGKRHIVIPFGGRQGGDVVRVIAASPGVTSLTIASTVGTVTKPVPNVGGWDQFLVTQPTVFTTDKPVLVAQYAQSNSVDRTKNFDPDMVVITPEEQFVNAAVFQTLPNYVTGGEFPWDYRSQPQYTVHYVTIVGQRQGFATITLNGEPLTAQPGYAAGLIANTPYQWATMEVDDGRIHVLSGDALFGGYVYGLGSHDSYAWPIGAGLRKFDVPDKNPPELSALRNCGGYEVVAREGGPFESGLINSWLDSAWSQNVTFARALLIRGDEYSLGQLTLIDPRQQGRARVIAEDQEGNRDTIELTITLSSLGLDRDSVLLRNVEPGRAYYTSVVLTNPNPDTMQVEDVVLITRKEFFVNGDYRNLKIAPGRSLEIKLGFGTNQRKIFCDTLRITSQCQNYRVPLTVLMGIPAINTIDLDFGTLRVGKERCLELPVYSTGDAQLIVDSLVIEGDGFSVPVKLAEPITLEPGRDTTITVCFRPEILSDSFRGTVRFHSNADSVAVSNLKGKSVYPLLSIGGYDFGSRQIGDTLCTRVPITNIGGDTAHVTGLEISDPAGFLPDNSVFPKDLANGDTLWVDICFMPAEERRFRADIFPKNSDGLETGDSLLGRGYRLRATISGYDWKERWVGSVNDTVIFVRNLSSDSIAIDRVWIDNGDVGDFNVEPLQATVLLAPGERLPVAVRFIPMMTGERSCMIYASTSSREQPTVDSVLLGFGLMAMASDTIAFDGTALYSCGSRSGSITIYNDGNTELTLRDFAVNATPSIVQLRDPSPDGQKLAAGDSLVVNFVAEFAGHRGRLDGNISWRFAELPETYTRNFSVDQSTPQIYSISATAPPQVAIGDRFDVIVRVDSTYWRGINQNGVTLRLSYNPTVARFDLVRWSQRSDSAIASAADWQPDGAPTFETPGNVTVKFRAPTPMPLDSVVFLSLPFHGFLGNNRYDTIHITMSPSDELCDLPAQTSLFYQLDSICGLSNRLFEYTGKPYVLKQNNPNPTASETTIEFTLGMEAPTMLEIFASNGERIGLPVDNTLRAGEYAIKIDLHSYSSGIYYYRLTSGPFVEIKRMVVAK